MKLTHTTSGDDEYLRMLESIGITEASDIVSRLKLCAALALVEHLRWETTDLKAALVDARDAELERANEAP